MFTSVSVVVPTMNEADNVHELVSRLARVPEISEVYFVDDSRDDRTIRAIEQAATVFSTSDFSVKYYWRTGHTVVGGLSGAVIDGFRRAAGEIVVVMDADLQHPPETIPSMLAAMRVRPGFVVASRYCNDGSNSGLDGRYRQLVSRSSTIAAKAAFPGLLREVTDPMTGFFAVTRSAVNLNRLNPRGFKILMEMIVTHPELVVTEVPFNFGERHAGASKTDASVGLEYLTQLLELRFRTLRSRTSKTRSHGEAVLQRS